MGFGYYLNLRQDEDIISQEATNTKEEEEEEEEERDGFIIQINVSQTVFQQQDFLYPDHIAIPRKYDSQIFNVDRHLLLSDHHNLNIFMSNILSDLVLLPMPIDHHQQFIMAVTADLIGGDKPIPVFSQQALTQLVSQYAWLMANNSRKAGRRLLPLLMDFQVNIIHTVNLLFYNRQLRKECSICQQEFQRPQVVVKLSCAHDFHQDCILRWQEKSRFCPICNSPC